MRFDAVATTGGRPSASSTGKVMTDAPPTSDAIRPPTTPVPIEDQNGVEIHAMYD